MLPVRWIVILTSSSDTFATADGCSTGNDERSAPFSEMALMDSAKVAKIGVQGMLQGKPYVVAGLANAAMAQTVKFVPKSIQAMISAQIAK